MHIQKAARCLNGPWPAGSAPVVATRERQFRCGQFYCDGIDCTDNKATPCLLVTRALRQLVADLVVISLFSHEYMFRKMRRRRSVECTHSDGDEIHFDWVPEQKRPAYRAKSATYLCGGLVPGEIFFARDRQQRTRNVCRGKVMSGLLPTLHAMACVGRMQVSGDNKSYATAEASATPRLRHRDSSNAV
jgi:hypothetical protein